MERELVLALAGLLAGVLAGFLGIGGGTVMVPVMVALGLSIRRSPYLNGWRGGQWWPLSALE